MSRDDRLHHFWAHAFILVVLSLAVFPAFPALYLFALACYYGSKALFDRHPSLKTLARWILIRSCAAVILTLPLAWIAPLPEAPSSGSPPDSLETWYAKIPATFVLTLLAVIGVQTPFWGFAWFNRSRQRRQEIHQEQLHDAEQERIAEQQRRRDADQRRRSETRSQCELLFNLHSADIANRFTRKMFDDYMAKYMSDAEDADTVERRGRELSDLIQRHRQQATGEVPTSLTELAAWFLEEKTRIEGLPLDEEFEEEHLAHLNIRYSELSQGILEKIKP
ncbi:MAG TPA: hypothetical protein VMV10_10855 [Pirellulales bacterium]|nr:hypothetical protein [Pirellulales bacterium]